MKHINKIWAIIFFLGFSGNQVTGQYNLTSYQLYETLPQANEINPAFIPNANVIIGLPAISNIYASGALPVSLSSFVNRRSDDSLQVDLDKFVNSLSKKNDFSIEAQVALLYAGFRIKKGFLSISVRSLNDVNLTFPKELVELAVYGNGMDGLLGNDVDLSSVRTKGHSTISTSIGYARPFLDDKLTIGVRLAYIKGYFSVESEKSSEIHFKTSEEDYSIYISAENLTANVSGMDFISEEGDPVEFLLNTKNNGFGLDIGANYKLTDRLRLSGAITDIGYINWKSDVTNFNVSDSSYTYRGFDIINSENFLESLPDTLKAIFDPTETSETFSTSLITKFYAAAHFQLGEIQRAGAVFQSVMFRGRLRPALSLSYGVKINRILNTRVSYSIIQDNPFNLGLGFTLNAGFLQLYAVSDNVYGLVYPQKATYANIRFGLNLTFGRDKGNR